MKVKFNTVIEKMHEWNNNEVVVYSLLNHI